MRIAVLGVGGVGGYFGGRIAQAGKNDVVFVARAATLQVLSQNGLRVDSIKGNFEIPPSQIKATSDTSSVGVADAVLVCTKAWQVKSIVSDCKPLIGQHTIVVPLQNGVESSDELVSGLGDEYKYNVIGGSCRIFSFIDSPGIIKHLGAEPRAVFGQLYTCPDERKNEMINNNIKALCDAFNESVGVQAHVSQDIKKDLWLKLMLLAPLSGIGSVTRAPFGILRSIPQTNEMIKQGVREVAAVAQAHNINITDDDVDRTLEYISQAGSQATTSMQRDVEQGKPSELEDQCGAVIRYGAKAGVQTPLFSFLFSSLLPQEMIARGQAVIQ